MLRRIALTAALTAPLLLTACVGVSASRSYQQDPSIGQQLIDLKKALDQGAINEDEYNRLKAGLISEAEAPTHRR